MKPITKKKGLNLLNIVVCGGHAGLGSDFGDSLISKCDILFNRDGVFNLPHDNRKGDEQATTEESPVGGEHMHVLDAVVVQSPCDSTTSRLDAFVETSEVGKLAAVVGESTHEPVDTGLPCSIGETVEHVEDERSCVSRVRPVLLGVVLVCGPSAGVGLLEHVAKAPDDHDGNKESNPSTLGTGSTANALEVEGKTEDVRANDLHDIVYYAVQCSSAGVEVGAIDLSEVVGVKPVGRQEHGEQRDDVGVGHESLPETKDLGLPRRVLHDDDLGAISTNDISRVDKHPGKRGTDDGEDEESDVGTIVD